MLAQSLGRMSGRVVLVENLRRLAESIVRGRTARETADALADDLLGLSGDDTRPATLALQKLEEVPVQREPVAGPPRWRR